MRHTALLILLTLLPQIAPAITREDAKSQLLRLDAAVEMRESYIAARQQHIDSLTSQLRDRTGDLALMDRIVEAYTSFNNDSALTWIDRAVAVAPADRALPFKIKRVALLPLAGLSDQAVDEFEAIDADDVPDSLKAMYYDSGRQMYSYLAASYSSQHDLYREYSKRETELMQRLLNVIPRGTNLYNYHLAEYLLRTGAVDRARTILEELVESGDAGLSISARANHHLSKLARADGDENAYVYYLASSATDDALAATREVISLQELGSYLITLDDVHRSYNYLSAALANAVECGASVRMIESSRALPLIQQAHNQSLESWSRTVDMVIVILSVILCGLGVTLVLLRREILRQRRLQHNLRETNRIKEEYISRFMSLCSIYMDKLNQFCKLATRKIGSGNVDDFYRLVKSGKFVEEQTDEFYEVFDDAFLHIYPSFVEEVNRLLRPDAQIVLRQGERLNTDLRILAFMRLGIDDGARIAQVLNYSINTVYAYRNRIKGRAINRETFEADILKIGE